MLLVRTPFRVSFFGGGTDYHEYFSEYGGSVLSTAIDKYCYVTLRNMPSLFSYRNQLTYSKIERFNSPDELEHPLVREALKYIPTDRIQIAYDADLPACSGLGSSSAFAVGLLQGLHALKDEYPDSMTLAKEAIHLERTLCNEAGGVQDQLATAFGGLNRIDMNADGYAVTPVKLSEERLKALSESFMMIFTGFTRHSSEVASMQKKSCILHSFTASRNESSCTCSRKHFKGRLCRRFWQTSQPYLAIKEITYESDKQYRN